MNIGVAEIRDKMADVLNRVAYAGERVILQRRGKGVAAIVSLDDLRMLEALEDAGDVRTAKRARREKGEVSLDEVKNRLEMK